MYCRAFRAEYLLKDSDDTYGKPGLTASIAPERLWTPTLTEAFLANGTYLPAPGNPHISTYIYIYVYNVCVCVCVCYRDSSICPCIWVHLWDRICCSEQVPMMRRARPRLFARCGSQRRHTRNLAHLCEKRHLFLSFPYVCPEPVLAK